MYMGNRIKDFDLFLRTILNDYYTATLMKVMKRNYLDM